MSNVGTRIGQQRLKDNLGRGVEDFVPQCGTVGPDFLILPRSVAQLGTKGAFDDTFSERSAEPHSLVRWVELIQEAWSHGAGSTLELSRLMSRARRSLRRGHWSQLWRSAALPFSKRKGEMLVVIGDGLGGLNAQNSAHLPLAWNTLYYLARLGRLRVEPLIQQQRIHPKLRLGEAKALLAERVPATTTAPVGSRFLGRLERFSTYVRTNCRSWPRLEQEIVSTRLRELAEELEAPVSAPTRSICGTRADDRISLELSSPQPSGHQPSH